MRLNKHQIKWLSEDIVNGLVKSGLVDFTVSKGEAVALTEKAIVEELRVEDVLGEEVKDILTAYQKEIDQGQVDYNAMFEMIKKKLVKERGIVI
jgi:hypothetical protein